MKDSNFRKVIAVFICALMLLGVFAGCDGGSSVASDDEAVKLVIFAPTLIVKDDEERQAEYKQIFKEAIGIDVEFVTTPINGFEEKLGVMLSSNQQIDLIWTTGVPSIVKMVNQGFLTPIDDYVANSEYLNSDAYLGMDGILY